jgi:cellulose synthase/poly-beta-1,6-N-acetylglucosamine synthase-like glycosyltransferase
MLSLRIIGICVGLAGLVLLWYARFALRQLRKGEWLFGSMLAIGLVCLGLLPNSLDAVLSFLSFHRGGGGRLIGLLVLANIVLYFLMFLGAARHSRMEQTLDRLVRELAKTAFRQNHSPTETPIQVIVPAYNEAENIGSVLQRIPKEVCGVRTGTIVIVDGATDDTAAIVNRLNLPAVRYIINRGGGSALKAGYELALENGAEIIVTLDADGQHNPEEIPMLVRPILDGEADLVNGSRVLGNYEKDGALRAVGVTLFNWLVTVLTMTRITDCSNAFRAIRASALLKLDLRQMQFHTPELLIEALNKGFQVKEVPITIHRRQGGQSKKGPSLSYASGFMRAIVRTWLR